MQNTVYDWVEVLQHVEKGTLGKDNWFVSFVACVISGDYSIRRKLSEVLKYTHV